MLKRRDALRGLVRHFRHMRGKRTGGIEQRFPPPDEDPLIRISIVARPAFISVAEESEIDVSAAGSAGLDHHLRIFRTHRRKHIVESDRVVIPEVRLTVRREIG